MGATTVLSELAALDRGQVIIDTGITYDGVTPVRVRVSKRERRYGVTDDGTATSTAGADSKRTALPNRIQIGEYEVNVTRHGIVCLSAVGPTESRLATLCELVARGSIAVYEQLLEAADD
jgi:hypothetical protein